MISNSLGRYEIQSEIGRGGMATVYLAYDPRFRRQVAVKVLSSQFLTHPVLRARFEREARLIATIEHPAIVPVYDFGEQDDQLYLVMRYMIGGPLSSKLRNEPLPFTSVLQILSQLAPALDVVHARGVVHRDLKPGNILFDGFENPALSDFGIAYLTEASVQLTGDAVIGTPAYMSPEQVQGDMELDGRSDIYALGVILYEMLTGRQPFRSATPMSTALKHLSEPAPKISINRPDLPPELDVIQAKAMAKDREGRYQKASDMIFDLRALPEILSPRSTVSPGWQEASAPDEPTVPENEAPGGLTAQDVSLPVPAVETGSPPSLPSSPLSDMEQTGGLSKRAGFPAVGLSGITFIGLCSLLLLAGMLYRFVLQPGAAPLATISPATDSLPPTSSVLASPFDPVISPSATFSSPLDTSLPTVVVPLFSDDFSQSAHGWPVLADEATSYSYQDGTYRITVQQNDTLFWATPDDSFTDAIISVSTTLVSGSEGSYYGLICRLQGDQEFYYMVIRVDGSFTVGTYSNGEFLSLLPSGWTSSQAIRTGNDQNQLRADCNADQLRFYANGELLTEVRDDKLSAGKPGLAVASIGSGELDVRFDNFLITKP